MLLTNLTEELQQPTSSLTASYLITLITREGALVSQRTQTAISTNHNQSQFANLKMNSKQQRAVTHFFQDKIDLTLSLKRKMLSF